MNVVFEDFERPTALAAVLRSELMSAGMLVSPGRAKDMLGEMSGYSCWGELTRSFGEPTDDAVQGTEPARERISLQLRVLARTGVSGHSALRVVADLSLGVAARSPSMDVDIGESAAPAL